MNVRVPDYFDEFSCLAGACPHSCCIGWEVVLDAETVRRYQTQGGVLGQQLRAAMREDAEGDVCFPLDGGRCPFLDHDNLCRIHRALGEEATSVTCREHPRFTEDYGPFREITLSAACPKANALLLENTAPLTFFEREDNCAAEEGDEWLTWLVPLRDRLLDLLRDRSCPLDGRLGAFLLIAEQAQVLLDAEDLPALEHFAGMHAQVRVHEETAADATPLLTAARAWLLRLDLLEPAWRALLESTPASAAPLAVFPAEKLERIAVYFAFRYLLKAVNDGDLLGRAVFCVFALMVTAWLAAVCDLSEALRLFSREIEHDANNLDMLLDAFQADEAFSVDAILSALGLPRGICADC